jgi:hypothetical protein
MEMLRGGRRALGGGDAQYHRVLLKFSLKIVSPHESPSLTSPSPRTSSQYHTRPLRASLSLLTQLPQLLRPLWFPGIDSIVCRVTQPSQRHHNPLSPSPPALCCLIAALAQVLPTPSGPLDHCSHLSPSRCAVP